MVSHHVNWSFHIIHMASYHVTITSKLCHVAWKYVQLELQDQFAWYTVLTRSIEIIPIIPLSALLKHTLVH